VHASEGSMVVVTAILREPRIVVQAKSDERGRSTRRE
jgi:hypothetical protein